MKTENVSFYSEGCKIAATLYLPNQIENDKKYPTIILCHGFGGVKEMLLPAFATQFAESNFIALCFDYRGFGESEGTKGALIKNNQITDIRNAITYMETLDCVDANKIALWGTSYGGANIIEVAHRDKRVKCICSQLTFGNGERVIFRGKTEQERAKLLNNIEKVWKRKVTQNRDLPLAFNRFLIDEQSTAFYDEYVEDFPALNSSLSFLTMRETLEHKPEEIVGDLEIPTLFLAADNDKVNPLEETFRLYENAKEPKAIEVIQNVGHYEVYKGEALKEASKIEIDWFTKYLN